MSFQDLAHEQKGGARDPAPPSTAAGAHLSGDPFTRRAAAIRSELAEYQRQTAALLRCRDELGTKRDSHNMRKRMHGHIAEAEALVESLSQQVEALRGASKTAGLAGAERQERKDTVNELISQITYSTESFRDAVQSTLQKERDFLHAAEAANSRSRSSSQEEAEEEQELVLEEQDMEEELAFHAAMIDETHEDIQRISRNVVEVNAVFQNLAHMVDEQRADIDTIEGNMVSTEERVRSGLKHVDKAAEKQRAARAKMCALLVCLLVTAGVLLLIYRLTEPASPPPPASPQTAAAVLPSTGATGAAWREGTEEGRHMANKAASAAADALQAVRKRHFR